MKITSIIYKLLIGSFNRVPSFLQKAIVLTVKSLKIPNSKFYKDLRYKGLIKFEINNRFIKMQSYGGTIENEIFWKGISNSLEPETIWIWQKLIDQGVKSIIDIGANSGLYCIIASAMNPEAKIIAFEPSINTFKKLDRNIKLNNLKVIAERIAISNICGELTFYDILDENQTNASLSEKIMKENPNNKKPIIEYVVITNTLDFYCKKNNLNQIDLIKIDVELHEPEVFEGMKDVLNINQPFLLFEVLIDEIAAKLNRFFISYPDYVLFEFVIDSGRFYLKPINSLIGRPEVNWNYFACHKSKLSQINSLILH